MTIISAEEAKKLSKDRRDVLEQERQQNRLAHLEGSLKEHMKLFNNTINDAIDRGLGYCTIPTVSLSKIIVEDMREYLEYLGYKVSVRSVDMYIHW